MKIFLYTLYILRLIAATDLGMLFLTGGYHLPGTHWDSLFPVTSLFLVLLTSVGIHHFKCKIAGTEPDWSSKKWVFIILWMVFLSNFRWCGSGDTVSASAQPFALLQHGNLYLDDYCPGLDKRWANHLYLREGHILSGYPSAAGLLLVPFDLVPALAGVQPSRIFLQQTQKIGASCMAALSAIFVLGSLLLFLDRKWALFLTIAFAFGTPVFSVSAQALWQHCPGSLFLAMGAWAALRALREEKPEKFFTLAGFCFAMASWCRFTNLMVFFAILGWVGSRRKWREFFPFALGAFLPLAALALDNYFHSGVPWATGYGDEAFEFTTPLLAGIAGILFSPSRGLFPYSPFLLFGVLAFVKAWRTKGPGLFRAFSLGILGVLVVVAKWHAWSGGWCFGPRLLADLAPLWVLSLVLWVPHLEKGIWSRFLFRWTVALSILNHALGAYVSWWWDIFWQTESLWKASRFPLVYLLLGINPSGGPPKIAHIVLTLLLLIGITWWAYQSSGPGREKTRIS